jgi:diguanylate cyclase (GGDEF)-like protein/PAS domain S-box-containing protein
MGNIDHAAIVRAAPVPLLVLSKDFVIREVNEAYERAMMRQRNELIGQHVFDAFPDNPDDPTADGAEKLRASLERVRDRGEPDAMPVQRYDIPVEGRARFEERRWAPTHSPVLDADGNTLLIIQHADDVTQEHAAQQRLAASERRFRALVEHATDLIVVVAADGTITYQSPAASRLRDAPGAPAAPRWGDRAHPEDRRMVLDLFARALRAAPGETVSARTRLQTPRDGVRWMDVRATNHLQDPSIAGIVMNLRDVTEQHEAEESLSRQAVQDPLTGLPNRRWFLDALARAVARARRSGRALGVLLIDIDHFKRVNDGLGHPAGDRLLVELAERMTGPLRPEDAVARLGGDEFVILAEDLRHETDALAIAERLAAAATGLYRLGPALQSHVTLSIGVATSAAAQDADTLLAYADAALYDAKRRGRSRIEAFDPAQRHELVRRMHVEHELYRAIDEDELTLHWQPIVRVDGADVVAAEALVRWQHPEHGLLGAHEFLPIAEHAGLMPRICGWVLSHAVSQAADWRDLPEPPHVFVNLSGAELVNPSLPDDVWALIAEHQVDPGLVNFEISERMLTTELAPVRRQLHALRERGFGIALDDFGAGNTALAWLQELPIDLLKLDRRFARTLDSPSTQAIVESLVRLAPALGIATVAEGVQSEAELDVLRGLGCDYVQGFALGRPQPAEELTARLAARAG